MSEAVETLRRAAEVARFAADSADAMGRPAAAGVHRAVADWMVGTAQRVETQHAGFGEWNDAIAVAYAYLGGGEAS